MTKRLIQVFLSVLLAASVLTGCGKDSPAQSYPLESVSKDGKQESYVYRAANQSVIETAKKLTDERKPEQTSKEDDKQMFLVYPDEWYNLQQDKDKPADTLIEVSNKEFVKQNYNPSFLQGFILGAIVDNLFGSNRSSYHGDYRGYTNRQSYKPVTDYHRPTQQEKKATPPLTKQGAGTIIKRSDNANTKVGSDGVMKKEAPVPSTGDSGGKIIKSPDSSGTDVKPKSSTITPPQNNSPPRTKVGGSGRIMKRR